ncbi:aminoacyl-histidine dipeptidase [Blautia liquoris]|uniref:Cytosol non-specific dipeptidase n=1 Tax=Blautia liquoris TaxID=2779518 RepID=A0A7M2RMG0_9FIRM|nr:aminoacyl-histidine dipeptidase [Blautia liquoris]QOV20747.1 aminoacyl-histidine dipeptidase [Blautia liquoris]
MSILEGLKPKRVFHYFEKITQIPHGSENTKQISDYLVDFAATHGLSYIQDESNNVIIRKEASAGYEHSIGVILQGHCDMVCEKTAGSDHDFKHDPLKLEVDGDFISAKDTTLGGDDGIAVAYMLAILEDDSISHPPLECVFTTDEEIGLLGANALDASLLKGKRMINLDSEEEGSIWTSCAGGMRSDCEIPVIREKVHGTSYEVVIDGLLGGHSGSEIDKNRANSNILLGRFLFGLSQRMNYSLIEAEGGSKDNAIPRISSAMLLIDEKESELLNSFASQLELQLKKEYENTDDGICITLSKGKEADYHALSQISREKLTFYLMNVPNGIQKMSGSIEGLVETSCNLGIFHMFKEDDNLLGSLSVRSSVESAKDALSDRLCYLTEFLGGTYSTRGSYPAWEYREDSLLRDIMVKVYEDMYQKKPQVVAIHAGLECGLFYGRIDGLDCTSIGPDLTDVHTTEEKMSISSAARVYEYLLNVLKELK